MAWPPVDELVRGSVQRSYLKEYGWWLDRVLAKFSFLEAFGYSLPRDDVKGVKFHQKGNYVWFKGPRRDVVIEYDPESSFTKADLWEDDGSTGGRFTSIDGALAGTASARTKPVRQPLDRAAIEATIKWWAEGLHTNANDLLSLASLT